MSFSVKRKQLGRQVLTSRHRGGGLEGCKQTNKRKTLEQWGKSETKSASAGGWVGIVVCVALLFIVLELFYLL